MIDLYYWPTPNGWKVTILLEELELPYRVVPVNIGRGEQFAPESGAILVYLAEKTGRFLPRTGHRRYDVLQWVMWQMGGLGPMAGQAHHFRHYALDTLDYAIERYTNEVNRLYGVMNVRLADREFLAGDYSIADMAAWPWVVPYKRQGQSLEEFPHLGRWFAAVKTRPAVERGFAVGRELRGEGALDEKARQVLFGQRARKT